MANHSTGSTLIDDLLRDARKMTDLERRQQRLEFAYGNLAVSTNHRPSRAAFEIVALRPEPGGGMSQEEFDEWASKLEWR